MIPTTSSARLEKPRAVTAGQIQQEVLSEALQHPTTLYPFGIGAVLLCLSFFVAPFIGLQALLFLAAGILCGAMSLASFVWKYFVRGASSAQEKAKAAIARQDEQEKAALGEELSRLYATLESGFNALTAPQRSPGTRMVLQPKGPRDRGLSLLRGLAREYHKVCDALPRYESQQSIVSMREISQLSAETYRQGLSVLNGVLELVRALQDTDAQALKEEIADIEAELKSFGDDQAHAHRKEIKQETLDSLKKRLSALQGYGEHMEKLLAEAETCEASLQEVCAELPLLVSQASDTSVDDVARKLESTIEAAREVQRMSEGEISREDEERYVRLGQQEQERRTR